MAILVLGGAGYIGSHTVYELIDAGRDVVIADNLETGHIEAVHPKAKFYQGDIRNREFVDSVFESEHIDGVIHVIFAKRTFLFRTLEHTFFTNRDGRRTGS